MCLPASVPERMYTKVTRSDPGVHVDRVARALVRAHHHSRVYSCRVAAGRTVVAVFHSDGVNGTITIRQASADSISVVNVDLTGLSSRAKAYHIHTTAIFPGPSAVGDRCDVVGGHFNPLEVSKGNCSASDPVATCEVGDMSGKYGDLTGQVRVCHPDHLWHRTTLTVTTIPAAAAAFPHKCPSIAAGKVPLSCLLRIVDYADYILCSIGFALPPAP